MAVALGKTVYNLGQDSCSGVGIEWNCEELDAALKGPVEAFVFDDQGMADIKNALDITETGFSHKQIDRHLGHDFDTIEDWRIGEAIAQVYLSDHRAYYCPWPFSRDERTSRSSLPGSDMLGLRKDEKSHCFVFGETKTSHQAKYPPQVIRGEKGLRKQLKNLRDGKEIRLGVKYLALRMLHTNQRPNYISALRRYLKNTSDFQLYGFLVRDVAPDENDLRRSVTRLMQGLRGRTRIELFALYLPEDRIKGIGMAVKTARAETS